MTKAFSRLRARSVNSSGLPLCEGREVNNKVNNASEAKRLTRTARERRSDSY